MRAASKSYYATQVYNLTPNDHRRFGIASVACAIIFVADRLWFGALAVPLLALYAVLAILYGASYVRGATGEDE